MFGIIDPMAIPLELKRLMRAIQGANTDQQIERASQQDIMTIMIVFGNEVGGDA